MKQFFSASKTAGAALTLALPAILNMQRIVTWISATNDLAGTVLSIWFSSLFRTSTAAALSGQAVMACTTTAGIVANDIVIVQDVVDPTKYERIVVQAVAANVSYTFTTNLVNGYSSGAKIYLMKSGGGASAANWNIPVGATTIDKENATAVVVTEKDQAMLVEFSNKTATCEFILSGVMRDY